MDFSSIFCPMIKKIETEDIRLLRFGICCAREGMVSLWIGVGADSNPGGGEQEHHHSKSERCTGISPVKLVYVA